MKYYLIEMTTYNDGTKDEVGMYTYGTLNEAVSAYHTKMGGMMKKDNVATEQLTIINSDNGRYDKYTDKFIRPVAEPVPETVAE